MITNSFDKNDHTFISSPYAAFWFYVSFVDSRSNVNCCGFGALFEVRLMIMKIRWGNKCV